MHMLIVQHVLHGDYLSSSRVSSITLSVLVQMKSSLGDVSHYYCQSPNVQGFVALGWNALDGDLHWVNPFRDCLN